MDAWPTTDEEREQAEREKQEARILASVAHQHPDELLSPKMYRDVGLDKLRPIEGEDFQWCVYVIEHDGRKYVGCKIIDAGGLRDMREFDSEDQALPVSTGQDKITALITERSAKKTAVVAEEKRIRVEQADRERGFPEGEYAIEVTYPTDTNPSTTRVVGTV